MSNPNRSWLRRLGRGALILLSVVLTLAGVALLGAWLFLRGSMARLDGSVAVSGLSAPVEVSRDALGVPTIAGKSRSDVAYATGYVHAQDRFFQMDLLRRVAAGELAALFGPAAAKVDRTHRFHRFRMRADAALQALTESDRALLERYAAGVNDGLAALSARPFEYGLLRLTPQPWRPADSLLVVWAMYFDLQDNLQGRELARGFIKEHTTAEQLAFLFPTGSRWDAPLDAEVVSDPPAPIPATAPEWFGRGAQLHASFPAPLRSSIGSNNWALAGSRSKDGGAIIANDMHLGIRLPHIWYRAVLAVPAPDGSQRRIVGVTLPGAPPVVVGSNGRVAWGFTNSYGDYLDLIELVRDGANPLRVKTAAGWEVATSYTETIEIKGAAPETLTILETSLGPIWEVGGRSYAVRWIAHLPGAVNLELLRLEDADNLAAAQAVGNRAGIPAQNMVAGDREGHIGWTIAGPLPNRRAVAAATFPGRPEDPALGFVGLRPAAEYPRVIDPPSGQLWTANARQLAGEAYAALGDGGADPGARAQQIRDDLTRLGKSDERGVYEIGLDDRALFISPWRDRALAVLDAAALQGNPQRAEFRRLLETSWDGHASVNSVGYRLARGFLYTLYADLFGNLNEQLKALVSNADFDLANPRWEVVIARLLTERPAGWLPPGRKDWREVELAAVDAVIAKLTKDGEPLSAATWGRQNTARIRHPFAAFIPALKRWLAAPEDQLAGDAEMPRVASPTGGQSERLAVTPGHEERGLFDMPGGQSGHPLSPYFLAGHSAWVKGEPSPLLPGPTLHTLKLLPR